MKLKVLKGNEGYVVAESVDDRLIVSSQSMSSLLLGHRPAASVSPGSILDPSRYVEAAPVAPRKIVAIGLNYQDHVDETGMQPPTSPLVFAKFPSCVIANGEPIVFDPGLASRVDWEVELGVVIGRTIRNVSEADVLSSVLGYTVGNDVSARDIQFSDGQWVRGKSLDTFCPVGPVVVTADEIPDPQALGLRTRVNGVTVQDSNTSRMIFGVAEILTFCSRSFSLEPGDLILTGTPWGCGEFMEPVRSLVPGDRLESEIDSIGTLVNDVRAEQSRHQ